MIVNETTQLQNVVVRLNSDVVRRLRSDVVRRVRSDIVRRIPDEPSQDKLLQEQLVDWSNNTINSPNLLTFSDNIQVTPTDLINGFHTEIAEPQLEWVSDFMYDKEWPAGHIVFLEAGCSLGKNTYIEELVRRKPFGKILILANRRANKAQIEKRLGIAEKKLFSKADVMSYQALELNPEIQADSLEAYDMIVVDEAHYFLKDSAFNSRTNVSLDIIMKTQRPVKVFMSATLWDFEVLLCKRIKKRLQTELIGHQVSGYMMKKSKQHIEYVACIDEYELLHEVRRNDEGWLIFVDSINKGEELQKKLGRDAVFISAENSVGSGVAAKEYSHLIETEQLNHRIVIATSLLDNGVNLKDRRLKNVYIDCNDRIEVIQMLGRKRCIDQDDSFKLYLPYQTGQDVWSAFHKTIEEINNWKAARENLNYENFPELLVSLNSKEADKYRTMVYMDEKKKKFLFNWLGYENLMVVKKDLLELCQAEDPFLTKLGWLFNGMPCPPILSTSEAVINRKISRIVDAVGGFIGKSFPKKSKEFESFMELFSEAFWREFCVDREANHRSDRMLQPKKINEACQKFNIPLRLEKKNVKLKGKKVTHYLIQKTTGELLKQMGA